MAREINILLPVFLVVAAILFVVPTHFGQHITPQNITADVCLEGTQCGQCIALDPACAWCETNNYTTARCDSVMNLRSRGCTNITHPQGSLNISRAAALTDGTETEQAVQVTPQEVRVTLKVGEAQTIRLDVRLAKDFPLDLYYLMDLSNSLKPDLQNIGQLGLALERELKTLTQDLQLGFGSFVDKTTIPFTTSQDTCETGACCRDCVTRFGFRNELPLTKDTGRFAERVRELQVSTSIDTPEGGLDALLQVAACREQIGWRDRARRMIVYATDAGFHMAGDGKLAGISSPNDGECHLDPVTNEYQKSNEQDFPSLGQINALLQKKNIIPVFAVDSGEYNLYQDISEIFAGAKVGVLAADSLNVVRLVTTAYREITSEVNIVDTAPGNIDVSYTSYCFGRDPVPGSPRCTDLLLQQVVSFDVTITATDCSPDGGPQTFTVRPFGFDESLTIVADVICSCDCESEGIKDPTMCTNGNGTVTCGQCVCDEGRYGVDCECDGDSATDVSDLSSCIRPNSTNPSVCQLRGQCICKQCVCDQQAHAGGLHVYGPYCECDNSCEEFQDKPCGGEERGECICDMKTLERECRCKPGYTGTACECITSTRNCETINGLLCNGWGNCTCEGKCNCDVDSPFTGDTCEDCPTCVGKCSSFQDCVLCKVFEKGPFTQEQCDMCAAPIALAEDLIRLNGTDAILCEYLDDDNCTILFTYELQEDGSYLVIVQETKVCHNPRVTGALTQVEWMWILIGIIGGILLIGIIIIALIRLGIFIQDRREYARFEKERKGANWNESDNPLFKKSTTTFNNPMHGK